jgi:hypothetical protein
MVGLRQITPKERAELSEARTGSRLKDRPISRISSASPAKQRAELKPTDETRDSLIGLSRNQDTVLFDGDFECANIE